MNMKYFTYPDGLRMTGDGFARIFGGPARNPESQITQREMDLAASIQAVTEEIDAAHGASHPEGHEDQVPRPRGRRRAQLRLQRQAPPRGPVRRHLDPAGRGRRGRRARRCARLADLLASENVVGLCHGRMEVGPRALGHRSIVGDPRSARMQSVMNLKIKQRESFRPFAPAVLAEHAHEWFEIDVPSPYMLLVAPVQKSRRKPLEEGDVPSSTDLLERVNRVRSEIPAVTHVDHSARVQTVHADTSPRFHRLLTAFAERTGCPVLVNTSFNVRGEPIVCNPEDAFRCFMSTEMDYLCLGPFLIERKKQPGWDDPTKWKRTFEAD
jgi:carbamoyltransferase